MHERVVVKLTIAKLVALLTLGLVIVPLAAMAQQAGKVYRIGALRPLAAERQNRQAVK
jgi:hypothetical protein